MINTIIEIDEDAFAITTRVTNIPLHKDVVHVTDLTPMYDLFINRMVQDGWLEAEE